VTTHRGGYPSSGGSWTLGGSAGRGPYKLGVSGDMLGRVRPGREELARERRLRRAAEAKGLKVSKSAVRDQDHPDFGRWWVVKPSPSCPGEWRGWGRYLTSLDGIELSAAEAFIAGYVTAAKHPQP
jgi:hypothetical protein